MNKEEYRGNYKKEKDGNSIWYWGAAAIVGLVVVYFVSNYHPTKNEQVEVVAPEDPTIREIQKEVSTPSSKTPPVIHEQEPVAPSKPASAERKQPSTVPSVAPTISEQSETVTSTSNSSADPDRKFWEDQAKREGVGAEGSTEDIQKRLDRKFWEDQAKREGVSAEGSTEDIQKRLDRKFWEDQAKRSR